MTKFVRIATVLTVLLPLAFLGSGCSSINFYTSSPQELSQELMGPPGKLKKQVIVAQFYNPSQAQDLDLDALLGEPLKDRLRNKCKRAFVQDSPRVEYLVAEHFGPITGVNRNLALMAEARAVGAGIVVTGSLWKVALEEEKRGIYPFRESVKVINVSLDLWMYDALTGAKIADARIFFRQGTARGRGTMRPLSGSRVFFPRFSGRWKTKYAARLQTCLGAAL